MNESLDFTITSANDILMRCKTEMCDVFERDCDRMKVITLINVVAVYEVELSAIIDVLEEVNRERKSKKFWQIWK